MRSQAHLTEPARPLGGSPTTLYGEEPLHRPGRLVQRVVVEALALMVLVEVLALVVLEEILALVVLEEMLALVVPVEEVALLVLVEVVEVVVVELDVFDVVDELRVVLDFVVVVVALLIVVVVFVAEDVVEVFAGRLPLLGETPEGTCRTCPIWRLFQLMLGFAAERVAKVMLKAVAMALPVSPETMVYVDALP